MATSHSSETVAESGFVCACSDWVRSACIREPFYKLYQGKAYCVLHFPGPEKTTDFREALNLKFNRGDFDFAGVWFPPDPPLRNFHFMKYADFHDAIFSGDTSFYRATFSEGAHFRRVAFRGAARFREVHFKEATDFGDTRFSGLVDFENARFEATVSFRGTIFMDRVRFAASEQLGGFANTASLDLQFPRIEKPDDVSFHTVTLRPSWFVNVDPRKFVFTNVDWQRRNTDDEIAQLQRADVKPAHRLLAIACRQLAVNAEENHRYEEASKFRYMAMEGRRLEHWFGFDFRRLSWWYWLASGYGERILRAALVLLGILLVSAVLYTKVGFLRWEPRLTSESDAVIAKRDQTGAPLPLSRALTYSAAVMTFQRPEPRPATAAAQSIVLLETILGPVQAALLALAIRRKFMR